MDKNLIKKSEWERERERIKHSKKKIYKNILTNKICDIIFYQMNVWEENLKLINYQILEIVETVDTKTYLHIFI
jgi:hypothetical protein